MSADSDSPRRPAPPQAMPAGQRGAATEAAIVLAAVFGYSAVAGFGLAAGLAGAGIGLVALGGLALAAGRIGSAPALSATTLGLLLAVVPVVAAQWPLPPLLAVALFLAMARFRGRGRLLLGWLRAGRLDAGSWALVAATVGVSAVALTAWALTTDPASPSVEQSLNALRTLPAWSWPLIVLAFAAVNAAAEEAVYRGVFQEALANVAGAAPAVALQAAAFGLLHYHGFPSGVAGIALAAIFGALLGILRVRSGGMLAPWLAHVGADVAVVVLALALLA